MKFLTLLLFLIVTSKDVIVVYGQSTTNCFNDGSPCNKLNGILAPCNGAFGPPPANVSTTYVYSVDNVNLASCMCNQNAYDTLSSCVSCYSNVNNSNVKIAEFPNYQKSCKRFNHAFGKPLNEEKSDTVDKIKFVLIGVFILLFIIGGLSIWFWYRRRSKRMSKEKEKKEKEKKKENRESLSRIERPTSRNSLQEVSTNHQYSGNERSISRNSLQEMSVYQTFSGSERPNSRSSLQEASVHQPFSGNEIQISIQEASAHQPSSGTERSTSRNSSSSSEELLFNPEYRRYSPPSPTNHTGLFPPPGTIHQQYSIPGNRPHYTSTSPRYSVPIPTPSLQMYLPQQPQPSQPPQPSYSPSQSSAQMLPRPPVRNSYQHPNYYNRGRNLPSPPHNYYNANNYYGGY